MMILRVVKRILTMDQHQVTTADWFSDELKGKLAFFDLILLDIMMPEMDGYEIMHQIRDETSIPIIFLTSKTQEEELVYELGLGADDYIKKPFSPEELRARIQSHLRREQRKIKTYLTKGVLIDVSEKISSKQLDFEIQPIGVTEIDAVLFSMKQMKEALADSLEVQWKMEQDKQKQLSALVHDLKTPITVLEGNLYLLQYETVSEEGKKSMEDMSRCVKEMKYYVTQLLEISRNNLQSSLLKETGTLDELVNEVLEAMDVFLKQKNIVLQKDYCTFRYIFIGKIADHSFYLKRRRKRIINALNLWRWDKQFFFHKFFIS